MTAQSLLSPLKVIAIVAILVASGKWLLPAHNSVANGFEQVVSAAEHGPSAANARLDPDEASAAGEAQGSPELEQRILATTVRIAIETWMTYVEGEGYVSLFGDGHGTVLGGRYLLTHNHFRLPLQELLADKSQGDFATMTLYAADGSVLWQGPLTTASIAHEDAEALLLQFRDRQRQPFFDALGVPSAEVSSADPRSLPAGAAVTQVNWDTEQAYVQWSSVKGQAVVDGTAAVKVSDCLVPGSSGGGLFLDGVHIGNNWSRSQGCVQSADDVDQLHNTVALNSDVLLAAVAAAPGPAVQEVGP